MAVGLPKKVPIWSSFMLPGSSKLCSDYEAITVNFDRVGGDIRQPSRKSVEER